MHYQWLGIVEEACIIMDEGGEKSMFGPKG
jgi:hypothetical protein